MNSGHTIIALLQKAADLTKEDCARAMDVAHRLSYQIRAAEDRAREAEAEASHFRDRATRAEGWMLRIREEVEQTFFHNKDRDQRQAPSRRNVPSPSGDTRASKSGRPFHRTQCRPYPWRHAVWFPVGRVSFRSPITVGRRPFTCDTAR
jgi:hypothetical protein